MGFVEVRSKGKSEENGARNGAIPCDRIPAVYDVLIATESIQEQAEQSIVRQEDGDRERTREVLLRNLHDANGGRQILPTRASQSGNVVEYAEVVDLVAHEDVDVATCDMCAYGMKIKDELGEALVEKRAKLMSNSP